MERYEIRIGYLEHEDRSDQISLPMRIRERHLTPDAKRVWLQAIGPHLQISAWTGNDNIIVRLPFKYWETSKMMKGTLTGANNGILAVGRYEDNLANEDDKILAAIQTHDYPEP